MANPVIRWQLVIQDPERAAAFYAELFGWQIDADNPLGYRIARTGAGGIDGGFWPSPPDGHNFVQLHVQVDDVAAVAQAAEALGAKVVVPPQTLPEGDEMAVLVDPQGVPFAVTKPA